MLVDDLLERAMTNTDLKKGSAELLILSLLEPRPRHGYELSKLIESRSRGAVRFNVASLYPLLYRLEKRGLLLGRWVEKAGQRRRRFYRLTAEGRKVLAARRRGFAEFVDAVRRIVGYEHA
jgi:transcriptional regulator